MPWRPSRGAAEVRPRCSRGTHLADGGEGEHVGIVQVENGARLVAEPPGSRHCAQKELPGGGWIPRSPSGRRYSHRPSSLRPISSMISQSTTACMPETSRLKSRFHPISSCEQARCEPAICALGPLPAHLLLLQPLLEAQIGVNEAPHALPVVPRVARRGLSR